MSDRWLVTAVGGVLTGALGAYFALAWWFGQLDYALECFVRGLVVGAVTSAVALAATRRRD